MGPEPARIPDVARHAAERLNRQLLDRLAYDRRFKIDWLTPKGRARLRLAEGGPEVDVWPGSGRWILVSGTALELRGPLEDTLRRLQTPARIAARLRP